MRFFIIAVILCLFTLSEGVRYVAYYTAWSTYGRKFDIANIPIDKLSHLNYAFANIDSSGKIVLGDSYADIDKAFTGDSWDTKKQAYRGSFWQLLKVVKPKYPNVKMLISIGGWTWSTQFSNVAANDASRKIFTDSVVEFLKKYEFDGIDLDWEYPVEGGLPTNVYRPEDGKNYNLLLATLRSALDAMPGGPRLITIAAPAGPQISQHLLIKEMAKYVNSINIMTYDYRGGWSKYTGHQTPLYPQPKNLIPADDPDKPLGDTATAVQYYIDQGMPASKIVIGFAMYGRGWAGVTAGNTNGLYQPFQTIPQGTWDDGQSGATGVYDYKAIKAKLAAGGITRYWDSDVKAPWVFGNGLMISYDDAQSVKEKINFVKSKGLGGVMTWELSGDDNAELSGVVYANLYGAGGIPANTDEPAKGGTGDGSTGDSQRQPAQPLQTRSLWIGIIIGALSMLLLVGIVSLLRWQFGKAQKSGGGKGYFADVESPSGSKDSLQTKKPKAKAPKAPPKAAAKKSWI